MLSSAWQVWSQHPARSAAARAAAKALAETSLTVLLNSPGSVASFNRSRFTTAVSRPCDSSTCLTTAASKDGRQRRR
jgi:hypothetical protein